jgi:membrane protein
MGVAMNLKALWAVVKDAGQQWLNDKAPRLGAALAYYTVFSLAPLLVIIIALVGLVFGQEAAQGQISAQMTGLVGPEGGKAIEAMVKSASEPRNGILGTVLGLIMLVFGATGVFGQLQDALDTIWDVKPKAGRGLWGIIRDRVLSFSMVLGIAFLLLMSLVVSAALTATMSLFGDFKSGIIGQVITTAIDLTVVTGLFAMIYRFLPDAKIAWKDVWFGAIVTSVLFAIGKLAIGLYLGSSGVASGFGAAGSLAVLLVWLYYSAQIFLFGAELTRSYAVLLGSGFEPKKNAELAGVGIRLEEPRTHRPRFA